jgi:5-methylcytosine-specific restriction endonuclease McrA
MYNIEYNDGETEKFFIEYKDKIIEAINQYREPTIYENRKKYLIWEGESSYTKTFLNDYSQEDKLRKIITGKPIELLEIVQDVEKNKTKNKRNYTLTDKDIKIIEKSDNIKDFINENRNKYTSDFKMILKHIFIDNIYESIIDKKDVVQRKRLRICPYCGRNYIFSVSKKNGNVIKPQIDHFLPKSKYPYLAFSYYNLIPCCETCNMSCKKQQDTLKDSKSEYKITHPYERNGKDRFFEFCLHNMNVFSDFISAEEQNIEIVFNNNIDIQQYESFFALQSLYKEHNDIVHELLIRKQFWASEACQQYYKNLLSKNDSIGKKMILSFLGYYVDANEQGKRPFSKLLSDISDFYDELVKKGTS